MDQKKFREMSFRQKIDWIWDYYAVTIVVALVILVTAVVLIASMLGIRKDQQVSLDVLILDDRMNSEASDKLKDMLQENIEGNIEISFYSKSNGEQFQAFVVRTTSNGPDIIIAPENEMAEMAGNNYIDRNYKKLDDTSFYADAVGINTDGLYEDVYFGVTTGGKHLDNARLIYERYLGNE